MAAHRYRLVVMSNFLTLATAVDTFRRELVNLFLDLNPGSLVLVMGGYRGDYQEIYRQLQALAARSGLDHVPEAAYTPRIPDLARATASLNVRTDPGDCA